MIHDVYIFLPENSKQLCKFYWEDGRMEHMKDYLIPDTPSTHAYFSATQGESEGHVLHTDDNTVVDQEPMGSSLLLFGFHLLIDTGNICKTLIQQIHFIAQTGLRIPSIQIPWQIPFQDIVLHFLDWMEWSLSLPQNATLDNAVLVTRATLAR